VPRPQRGAGHTLEPSSRDSAGSNHDVRPAGAPSPSLSILCGHPRPCSATPRTTRTAPTLLSTGTGHRHACYCTSYESLSTAPSSPPEGAPVNHHASTLEVAPVQAQDTLRHRDWSKIRQDGHQLYGTVRHTATRIEIVRHVCQTAPSLAYKRRGSPPATGVRHGTTDSMRSHALRFPHDIGTRLNHISWDLEATPPLPPRL
jgi:hypothetical protein